MGALEPHHRMPRYADDRRQRLRIATLGTLAIFFLCLSFVNREGALATHVGAITFGALVLVLYARPTVRRLQGLRMVPELDRTLVAAGRQLEAGDAPSARAALESMSERLDDRLSGYRFVVLSALAYAWMHSGESTRARLLLDDLESSGWLDAGVLRRSYEGLVAGHALARVQMGDLASAERLIERLGKECESFESRAARLLFDARSGACDANAFEALLSEPPPPGRSALTRLLRLAFVSCLAPSEPRRASQAAALAESGQRPMLALREGWPELYALAQSLDVVGEHATS
jgi:hypothetical protein